MAGHDERPRDGRGPEPGDRPVAGSPPPAEGGAPSAFGTGGSDDDRIVLDSRTETEDETGTEPYDEVADPYARPDGRPYGGEQAGDEDETARPYGRHAGGSALEPDAGATNEPLTGTVLDADADAADGTDADDVAGHRAGDEETEGERPVSGTAGAEHRDVTDAAGAWSGLPDHGSTGEDAGLTADDAVAVSTRDEEAAATAGPEATAGDGLAAAATGAGAGADTPADPEVAGAGAATGDAVAGPAGTAEDRLLAPEESAGFERRWHEVKSSFVDDPRQAAEDASGLCEEVVTALTTALDRRRRELGDGWRGDDADTERLRTALRAYGSLLTRIREL